MGKRYAVYAGSADGSGPILKRVAVNASQTIKKGYLIVSATNKASVAAAAAADGTVLGVAAESLTTTGSVDADDVIQYDCNPNSEYWLKYTGVTKTSLTDEDLGKTFDLSATNAPYTVDLDDTTGGIIFCTGYNNDRKEIKGLILNRKVK